MTADEALENLKVDELSKMARNENKWNRECGKAVMILVYGEKTNHTFTHFKEKLKQPEEFIKTIKLWKRTATQWQIDMLSSICKMAWFNFASVKLSVTSTCAHLVYWINLKYKFAVNYRAEQAEIAAAKRKKESV